MDPALAREVAMLAKARAINEAIEKGDSQIQQFYKGVTVLITGGTGFMGKQFLEKLFRSCDIKKVFLLMRAKKKKSFTERLDALLEDPVFDTVKKMRPGFEKKIRPVQGDVAELGLGISEEDRAVIIAETEVIIHGAATINFDEPLKVAVNTNIRGTVEMLNLGKQCKKLKSYVHISTAYAHATVSRFDQEVDERFYDAPMSPQLIIDMVATMEESRINDITSNLIKNWPNTYTFTKAIAEEACRLCGSELPLSIVRPAIVIASHQEPSPGWLDRSCVFGPTGFIVALGLGVVHVFLAELNKPIDVVPVDVVNNAIMVAGSAPAKRRADGDKEPKIYTVTTRRNVIIWDKLLDIMDTVVKPNFVSPMLLYCIFYTKTNSPFIYTLLSWLWHYIPGYIIDVVLRILGKQPMVVKLYEKAEKHTKVLSYFTTNIWLFGDKNLQELYNSLNPTDKLVYNCDVGVVRWDDMLLKWCLGVRKYILRDGLQGTEYAKKKQYWMKLLHCTVVAPLYFFLLYKVAMLAFSFVCLIIYYVMSFFY